ncbi:ARF guanine-nucleotide exchange factor GNL2 isoform X2 [Dendrobium catenatum]|uniref:ARF guanine-nucleotide exchange factor GNL2 isoform X2 n=1 Tax=Dendrobium catenatum TaxID=906689 RepID=UPI0009F45D4E|nr:ARF guanine-nucleotide exchange factor GNL2 isoform X2 [Dendrobium catenatum]
MRAKRTAHPMAGVTKDGDTGGHQPPPCSGHRRLCEQGISCTLNTEVGMMLAVIRQPPDPTISPTLHGAPETDSYNSHHVQSLLSLRSIIFHPLRGSWHSLDPMVYLSPFLDIIQSEDVTAASTSAALYAVLKIMRLDIFSEITPGAREAIHAVVLAITNCRLELTDPASEDSILMHIHQVLTAVMHSNASVLLTDHAICTIVSSCFQIVQQSADRSDLLQRSARHAMHDLIEGIYSRLSNMRYSDGGPVDSGSEAEKNALFLHVSYTAQCMIDIFSFLCSLVNVEEPVDPETADASSDEEFQLFVLLLINTVVELGGDSINHHPGLLHIIQDDLFHHLIHYSTRSGQRILSITCNIVFSLYHFLRGSLRLQLEAFFIYVLLKIAKGSYGSQLQEVAVEGITSFCRQPNFIMEIYVNYDCDPIRHNVLEEIVKLLCKTAYPMSSPISSMQLQAFEALISIIHNIADGIKIHHALSRDAYAIDDSTFKPFWLERCDMHKDPDSWVEFVRMRKLKKKKIMMAANHYNRNEKKGMAFLNICRLVPSPPDAKSIAYFFRYTPRLDKNKIGDYLGESNDFNIKVLNEFAQTFEFDGVILDTALRTFLETFRLPGESQKIHRILEAFSERFYDQQTSGIFASKDAVFILCYSLIMLNTDQHNPQVKKKMTEDEFIRNNRAINGGVDLPREYLSELFLSISTNAITLFDSSSAVISEMNSHLWANLMKQTRTVEPYILCDYKHKLCREVFNTISGLSVATICVIFEQTDDENVLQECIEGLFSIARIARYSLEDILDELLFSLCKYTTLLNPYATAEEIVFSFSNEVKPRMATLAIFTIANKFGESIRGAWRNLVDCLLKLNRLKLLPPTLLETCRSATEADIDNDGGRHSKSESGSGVIYPPSYLGSDRRNISGLVGRFTELLSLESGADSMLNAASDMENNLKIIQQCRIDSIFKDSAGLPQESLQHLIRALVFAAAGKGQKFSTSVEEEETVGFCWDLIFIIITANLHRLSAFWMQFNECLALVSQVPQFSPCPFVEKAMVALLRVVILILSSEPPRLQDRQSEEMVFKSINLTWKLDKDILDACNDSVTEATMKILSKYARNVQTTLGWKTLFHLLSVTGRHPENFDRGVETLIGLMTEADHITRSNYAYCIEAAFGFAALKISPVEKSSQILNLMAGSVKWIIQWQKSSFYETGNSNMHNSSSSTEEGINKASSVQGNSFAATNLFMKLAEALRKTSLVRREEIRNQAVEALGWCFLEVADELEWTAGSYASSFNLVIFAMVDDLHEKMVEYSRREGMEREMRSMEGTLKMALEQMVEVYLCFMVRLAAGPGFRTFWLGLLRRMDTCMKASLGEEGLPSPVMQELVPKLLKRMILEMKEKQVLVQSDESDLWEVTNIQIQWNIELEVSWFHY